MKDSSAASEKLFSHPEHALNEADLSDNIALCQPAHLSLADHVHCLVPLDRPQRAIHGSEPEAGSDAILHESMILLQDIIQVRTGPTVATATQFAALLEFRDGGRVRGVSVDINYSRPDLACPPQANCKKCFAATASRLGDSMKSIVSPAELTAR